MVGSGGGPEEAERLSRGGFLQKALREGQILYERG
jgi:hypothetical protein